MRQFLEIINKNLAQLSFMDSKTFILFIILFI